MRLSLITTLALPTLLLADPNPNPNPDPSPKPDGSLQALLQRVSKSPVKPLKHPLEPARNATLPAGKNDTHPPPPRAGGNHTPGAPLSGGHPSGPPPSGAPPSGAAPSPTGESKDDDSDASERMVKKKRWVWGTAIIQDDTPDAPPVGQNVNLMSSDAPSVETPTAHLSPPSFASSATSAPVRKIKKKRPSRTGSSSTTTTNDPNKRWIWGNAIVQDDSPTSGLPPPGVNANLLSGNTIHVNTPTATPTAPAFGNRVGGAKKASAKGNKRWVWGNAIIQDDTPTSGLPALGVNVNLFSSGAASVATPVASIVAPVFAPAPAVTSQPASKPSASTKASAVALADRIGANKHKGISGGHRRMKKWVWGSSIIQDGDAPPATSANTPTASLVPPSFPPISPAASTSAAINTPVVANALNQVASAVNAQASAVIGALANSNREALAQIRAKTFHGKRADDGEDDA